MAHEFEWDEDKRARNVKVHGVDFTRAAKMFDGDTIESIDDREDYGEERLIAFGEVGTTVYRVVYTWRGGVIRIISAQKASKYATRIYYETIYPR